MVLSPKIKYRIKNRVAFFLDLIFQMNYQKHYGFFHMLFRFFFGYMNIKEKDKSISRNDKSFTCFGVIYLDFYISFFNIMMNVRTNEVGWNLGMHILCGNFQQGKDMTYHI